MVIPKLNGLSRTHGVVIGVSVDTDTFQEIQPTTAALVAKSTQEDKNQKPVTFKTAKHVLKKTIVQNASQDISFNTKTTLMSVLNAIMLIALNVKTMLDIVKLVFTVTLCISLNKSAKSPSSIIVRVLSMEDAKHAMMVTELPPVSPVKMTVRSKTVKCVKMTNHAQNVNLDSF